eukprot:5774179-Amphidinium_carterae.1
MLEVPRLDQAQVQKSISIIGIFPCFSQLLKHVVAKQREANQSEERRTSPVQMTEVTSQTHSATSQNMQQYYQTGVHHGEANGIHTYHMAYAHMYKHMAYTHM